MAGCDRHCWQLLQLTHQSHRLLLVESEVVQRQWVKTLVLSQGRSRINSTVPVQACSGRTVRQGSAGPMSQLHSCVQLRQRTELSDFRSRLWHIRQSC